jgi:hypothetical protein
MILRLHPESMEGVLSQSCNRPSRPAAAVLSIVLAVQVRKWWYRKNNSKSAETLRAHSLRSSDPEVITIDDVCKFARRARDYMRTYRWGVRGLDVETAIQKSRH